VKIMAKPRISREVKFTGFGKLGLGKLSLGKLGWGKIGRDF